MQKYHDEPKQYKGYLKSALSPRDPVEGRGPRQVAPLEGKTANTPRLGPVSTSRQRIAELARQA